MTILLNLLFIFVFFSFLKNKLRLKIKKESIFIFSTEHLIVSINYVIIFIIMVLFFFRIIRIIISSNKYLDLNRYNFIDYFFKIDIKLIPIIIINIIFIVLILILIKNFFYQKVKINFIKLHYFYFIKFIFYRNIIYYIAYYDRGLRSYSKFLYYLHLVIRDFLFKIIIILFFIKGILLDNNIIYVGLLPYYGLYYFMISINNFIKKFQPDFDEGILQCYYPEDFCLLKVGLDKIRLYKNSLLFGSSYCFYSCIFYDFASDIFYPKNHIFYKNCDLYFFGYQSYNVFKLASNKKPNFVNLSIYKYSLDELQDDE